MQNLNLKDEEFQPERDVVTEERRWRTDNNSSRILILQTSLTMPTFTIHTTGLR